MDFHRIFHLLEGFHCDLLEEHCQAFPCALLFFGHRLKGAVHPKDLTIRIRDRVRQLQRCHKLFLTPAVRRRKGHQTAESPLLSVHIQGPGTRRVDHRKCKHHESRLA